MKTRPQLLSPAVRSRPSLLKLKLSVLTLSQRLVTPR
eukprot:COSAG06_NODE_21227_length_765_cov_0.782282_1_plen_36_part_01